MIVDDQKMEVFDSYDLVESDQITDSSRDLVRRIKLVVQICIGCITEFFSVLVLSVLYPVPQTLFDPKKDDIELDKEGKAVQKPVVFVHGYLHNSSGWIMHRYKFKQAGLNNTFTVNLGAFPNKSIPEYAEVLSRRIDKIKELTGRNDVQLVGHSMGGLVSSYYALNVAKKVGVRVTDIVTLNSPLQGTKLHVFGPGPCVRNMAYGSSFVKELSDKIAKTVEIRFFHIASKADIVVLPYSSALNSNNEIKGEKVTCTAPDLGHTAVLLSKKVIEREIAFLRGK